MLSFGGKEVLITSVSQSILIHVLSTIVPPNCVIKELYMIFAKFFWSNKATGRSKHWASWEKICLSKEKGGLGFRSMFDVSQAMFSAREIVRKEDEVSNCFKNIWVKVLTFKISFLDGEFGPIRFQLLQSWLVGIPTLLSFVLVVLYQLEKPLSICF
ncbi:hypothetical protein H5410_041995 [Solanum commersonii]|uniref:Uncharacterized protein n=1 Tax=Solanum commersonii TaxID=4109 RepID=A0A9J5XTH4_SOLCO|nr:hypothetical protein H5410_041995 [Solanum commersonii]